MQLTSESVFLAIEKFIAFLLLFIGRKYERLLFVLITTLELFHAWFILECIYC